MTQALGWCFVATIVTVLVSYYPLLLFELQTTSAYISIAVTTFYGLLLSFRLLIRRIWTYVFNGIVAFALVLYELKFFFELTAKHASLHGTVLVISTVSVVVSFGFDEFITIEGATEALQTFANKVQLYSQPRTIQEIQHIPDLQTSLTPIVELVVTIDKLRGQLQDRMDLQARLRQRHDQDDGNNNNRMQLIQASTALTKVEKTLETASNDLFAARTEFMNHEQYSTQLHAYNLAKNTAALNDHKSAVDANTTVNWVRLFTSK